MISPSDLTPLELSKLLNKLPTQIRSKFECQPLSTLLESMDFLPTTIAPTGKVLKLTIYDYIGKKNPDRDLESGLCLAFLFTLEDNATIAKHEHQDTGKNTDTIEIYNPLTPGITDLSGQELTKKPCLLGESHGINPMPIHSLILTIKSDRENAEKLGIPSIHPQKNNIGQTNHDTDSR